MSLYQRINDTNTEPWVIEEIKKIEMGRDELAALEGCYHGWRFVGETQADNSVRIWRVE